MLIYADVYNETGTTRLGDGPITHITSVKITDTLDALRTFTLAISALDYRSHILLVPGRRVRVYLNLDTGRQLLVEGFIENYQVADKLSGASVKLKCKDLARELQHYTTGIGREYNNVPISTIVSQLTALAGWTSDVDTGLGNATIKFDGVSVLKALQDLAKATGLHFRRDSGTTIKFGALGDEINLRLVQPAQLPYDIYFNDDVALIKDIATGYSEAEIINWMLPLGNKEDGVDRVTLQHATLGSPYTVQSMTGPDGNTYYYIEDTTSQAVYGERQSIKVFNDIKSVGTLPADLAAASNQLYTAAASMLGRMVEAEDAYTVNVVKAWRRVPSIGQKLRLVYRGEARQLGTPNYAYIDVNDVFWITKQTIVADGGGLRIKLDVSNRDIVATSDVVNIIADTVTDYNQQKV